MALRSDERYLTYFEIVGSGLLMTHEPTSGNGLVPFSRPNQATFFINQRTKNEQQA